MSQLIRSFIQVRRKRPWWHRVLLYSGFFGGAYLVMCYVLASAYVSPVRSIPPKPEWLRNVSIGGHPAWATPGLASGNTGKVVFVFAHGYGGDRAHWSGVVNDLQARGYEAIVPAMPGQDASPSEQVGFGNAEAKVLAETFAWVRGQGAADPKIVVVGVSMGGAAAWLSSAIDPSIDGVITEGAYASFSRAMNDWLDMNVPRGSVTLAPVVWIAKMKSGIEPGAINPEAAAKAWRGRPALVIQAGEDRLISRWHAERLSREAECPLKVIEGAEHANCYSELKGRYADLLVEFAKSLPVK